MTETSRRVFDVVGIGIGPANLSLAALLSKFDGVDAAFVERKPDVDWHGYLMLPGAKMQVHFLKDLVTPVDPTNKYSFPAFLVAQKRFYRLLVTGRTKVPRREFEQYFRWVAAQLAALRFGVSAERVEWNGSLFEIHTDAGVLLARNVVNGTGLEARLPECARLADSARVFHAERFLKDLPTPAGRVAVVGGGQSGAEIVHYLLGLGADRPTSIVWATSRSHLLPLDDSVFVDELFVPNFSRYFYDLPRSDRLAMLEQQKMASDGISAELIEAIYRQLYDFELIEGTPSPCRILVDRALIGIDGSDDGLVTTWRAGSSDADLKFVVDNVVCATGYRHQLPRLLRNLGDMLVYNGQRPVVRPDFSLDWTGPAENRVFVQNAARDEFGIADPNLSLLAWRSAVIANSLLGSEVFDTGPVSTAVRWGDDGDARNGRPDTHLPEADRAEPRSVRR